MAKVELEIYDTREDYVAETPQRAYFNSETAAQEYMRGYGEYFDYNIKVTAAN